MSFNTMRDKLHLAGEGISIVKTDSGVFTLLPAVAYDRLITLYGQVTEAFADGTGAATGLTIGQGNDADKFVDSQPNWIAPTLGFIVAPLGGGAPSLNGSVGILSANQTLTVTVTAAAGNGTGGVVVAAVAVAAIPTA